MKRLYETGAHPFLWQDGMRQDCIHFYDKIVWDRHSSIFMTRWHETGLHSFLWQDCMRPALIHFYDKMAWDRTAFIFMTSQHKTGTHPFYIGMYIHIYTHIYVHIYTSQKECLHIFPWHRIPKDWKLPRAVHLISDMTSAHRSTESDTNWHRERIHRPRNLEAAWGSSFVTNFCSQLNGWSTSFRALDPFKVWLLPVVKKCQCTSALKPLWHSIM